MSRFVATRNAKGWVPDDLPDISAVPWWDGPWNEPASGRVDAATTAALASMPGVLSVRTNHGLNGSGGVPYQFAGGEAWAVRTNVPLLEIRRERVPLAAGVTRRSGDPSGSNSDRQAFLIDGSEYVEMSSLNATVWGRGWGASVQMKSLSRWDLNAPWDAQGVKGTAAIKAPLVPHLPTPEEFARGRIDHALMMSVTCYLPGQVTGYARSSDGGADPRWVRQDRSSPLVAGMRMRLTSERFDRLSELFAECPDVVTLLVALRLYGVVVADRTSPDAGHALRLPQTGQIDLSGLALRISDFEIIR